MSSELTNAVIDLFEMFPELEDDLMGLFSDYVLKEIPTKDFEHDTKRLCVNYVKNCIQTIKQGIKADNSLRVAYLDVARYQTDRIDAAIEWGCDADLLEIILKKRPVPQTPEERHSLIVPLEVTKKRELY